MNCATRFACLRRATFACSFAILAVCSQAVAESEDAFDAVHIVLFGAERPLIVQLRVSRGDVGCFARWRNAIAEALREADGDQNLELDASELQHAATDPRLAQLMPVLRPNGAAASQRQTLRISGALEVAAAHQHLALDVPMRAESRLLMGEQPQAQSQAGQQLFETLDLDGNGRLSPAEQRTGVAQALRLDLDEDELVSLPELTATTSPLSVQRRPNRTESDVPLMCLEVLPSPLMATEKLFSGVRQSEGSRPGLCSAESLGLRSGSIQAFDADGDQCWDWMEATEFFRAPVPDVTIAVALPRDAADGLNTPSFDIHDDRVFAQPWQTNGVSLLVETTSLIVASDTDHELRLRRVAVELFRRTDRDANQYLDRKESETHPFFKAHFAEFDGNSDAMLYEDELLGAVVRRCRLTAGRTQLSVIDQGNDLFAVLDSDRSLSLSVRELRQLEVLAPTWDGNGDDQIGRSEIPQLYRLRVSPSVPRFEGLEILPQDGAPPRDSSGVQGPVWWRSLDVNQDGDVSRSEFLGTREVFEEIDTDHDGLLTAAEADRYEKRIDD